MNEIIKLVAQVIFGLSSVIFIVYSLLAIYALSNYGLSKTLTSALSLGYSAVAASLLSWGVAVLAGL